MMLEQRSIAKAVIFSLITCGIYALYWLYKLTEEAHQLSGERTTATGGMVILYTFITCGIYSFYWFYKMGITANMIREQRGMTVESSSPVIYLLLSLFGLGIVAEALLQDTLNTAIAHDQRA